MQKEWQEVANWIADNLTWAQLEELCGRFGLDLQALAGESRQETADAIVQTLAQSERFDALQLDLEALGEGFSRPGTLSTEPLGGPVRATAAERIVNTGFAAALNPHRSAPANVPLDHDGNYFFWLEIGPPTADSIETEAVPLDVEQLPEEALLDVVLFSFPGELALTPGQDRGQLRLEKDRSLSVARPAASPAGVDLDRRLFFPVHTPAAPGIYRLRCHIYYRQLLLQSRLVTAHVSDDPEPGPERRLSAKADYVIAKTLDPGRLVPLPENRLSLLLNDNGGGTHGLRFWGSGEFKNDASFDGGALQNALTLARGALRQAAWGDEEAYDPGKKYRYDGRPPLQQLRTDLLRLAVRGYRLFDVLINELAGGAAAVDSLQELMRTPGHVQIAAKENARLVLPAAIIYDHWLDTGLKASDYRFCPEFESWLQAGKPLEDCPCFQGNCPSYGDDDIVCPSGFWGFRHYLGLPVTLPNGPDAPTFLPAGQGPELSVAVSTDPNFVGREAHEQALRQLAGGLTVHYANERPETLDLLKQTSPHVFYFFCHGRIAADTPSLVVGPPDARGISRDNLRSKRIRWESRRPLVFLNGCHTAALSPDKAIDLVSGFVDTAQAAGVIGTEIVNFVPLARTFSEETLRRFYAGQTIGEAIRAGRLAVLQQGNPLGLIFVPYVMSALKIS